MAKLNLYENNGESKSVEEFLENYSLQLSRLLNAGDGFIALKEILEGNAPGELPLSEPGRFGLAHIIGLLHDGMFDAYDTLPSSQDIRKLLAEARS